MKTKFGVYLSLIFASILLFGFLLSYSPKKNGDLAGLIVLNVANATKPIQATGCIYSGDWNDSCKHNGVTVKRCFSNATGECWY